MMEDGLIVHYNPAALRLAGAGGRPGPLGFGARGMLTQYGTSIFEQYLQRRSMAYLDQWFDLIVPPVPWWRCST
jgi:hypothetical protein